MRITTTATTNKDSKKNYPISELKNEKNYFDEWGSRINILEAKKQRNKEVLLIQIIFFSLIPKLYWM